MHFGRTSRPNHSTEVEVGSRIVTRTRFVPRVAQQLGRETVQSAALACEAESERDAQNKTPKSLRITDLGDEVQRDAKKCENRPGGIRTPDQGIMSPWVSAETPEEIAHSGNRVAGGAAVDSENALIDADRRAIIQAWPDLPDVVRVGIVAMVRAAGG